MIGVVNGMASCLITALLSASVSETESSENLSPLSLEELLRSVKNTHPELEEADQIVESARAKRFAARGAWDPKMQLRGQWYPLGYYENAQFDAIVRQATPLWGIGIYAGYRIGWGDYPIYKGNLKTLPGGELRAGMDIPLAKDRAIDPNRAEIKRTSKLSKASECKRRTIQLKLGLEAAKSYWAWVASGQELRVQRELLAVAQQRDAGLRDQAELGSIPPIDVVDNQRLVLERQSKLIASQQKFQGATLDLSLYLRDSNQNPVRISENRLPTPDREASGHLTTLKTVVRNVDAEPALRRRPEVCELQQKLAAARVQLRLSRNQRSPQINTQAFVARDIGIGANELAATEFGIGLSVELPLALTQARGNFRSAQAEVNQWNAKYRGLRDRIAIELQSAQVGLEAAYKQIEVAQKQVEAAKTLAEAERHKLIQGASNLVIVNLREIAAADAARQEIEVIARFQYAVAEYLTASGVGVWRNQ